MAKKQIVRPDDLLLEVNEDGFATLQICEADLGMVSNQHRTYPEEQLACYPLLQGGRIFIVRTTRVAQVEAQKIHDLKHSAILAGIFSNPEEDIQSSGKLYVYPILIVCICLVIGIIAIAFKGGA